jgi:copper(I)-binding protein
MRKALIPLVSLVFLSLIGCADSQPEITDGWIRLAPPNANVNAGYLTIENPTDQELELVSGSAEGYKAVELHMMRMNGGNMIMRQVESFTVPANGSLTLSPGSDHLMLIEPSSAKQINDSNDVVLSLKAEDGSLLDVRYSFVVKRN